METRQCKKCHIEFTLDQDDFSFYEKMKVPPPNICSDCRFKMRAMWRNEMSLYNDECSKTGEPIITMYNPKNKYNIVTHDYYSSDEWDVFEYALNYDYNKSFFEQLYYLLKSVPKPPTYLSKGDGPNINSNYSNYAGGLKNCYLVFNCGPLEESMYTRGIRGSSEVVDCYFGIQMELCYESVNCPKSSRVIYGQDSNSCVDCILIKNCSGLTNCFGCVNLRNKSNCWFNEQLTPDEYESRVSGIIGNYSKLKEFRNKFENFCSKFPHRENHNIKTENSSGDYLTECKNIKDSFEIASSENCKFLFSSKDIKDSIGTVGFGFKSENLLECTAVGYSSNVIGSCQVTNSSNIFYSNILHNCHDCIGCDGLKNAEYCILNKQYTKEEYEKIKEHIIKELTDKGIYGLMMPPEIAPFAYNETIAQDNMPLTKEEAIAEGFRWEDDIQMTKGKETLQPEEIPDHINDIDDEITKEILRCIECERNYKITEQELLFYRKMKLPAPRKCFFCRHQDRIKKRGPYKFWDRKCDNCGKNIKTSYSPDRPEIVYCEKCYQQEVI